MRRHPFSIHAGCCNATSSLCCLPRRVPCDVLPCPRVLRDVRHSPRVSCSQPGSDSACGRGGDITYKTTPLSFANRCTATSKHAPLRYQTPNNPSSVQVPPRICCIAIDLAVACAVRSAVLSWLMPWRIGCAKSSTGGGYARY